MRRDCACHTPSPASAALRIRGLAKSFGDTLVLDAVDLDVARGELITVLGSSGSGKTTLLRLLCGFERADGGRIELAGRPIAAADHGLHVPPERRGVGYVAQEGALFPHLSVEENILFGLPRRARRGPRAERLRRVQQLLDLMGLPAHYARRRPSALSGGEQQRVALARSLAPKPAVVLLDEPFSALDAGLRASTRATVVESLKQVGATALLVTHDQDEALSMGDRVAVLQRGRVVQAAAPQTVYRLPANREVAAFVGDAVLVAGSLVDDHAVDCCFGRLPLARESLAKLRDVGVGERVEVMVRPEQFRLGAEGMPHDAGSGGTAVVRRLDFYGHDARIALQPDNGPPFLASVPGIGLPAVGMHVAFRVVGPVVAYPDGGTVEPAAQTRAEPRRATA